MYLRLLAALIFFSLSIYGFTQNLILIDSLENELIVAHDDSSRSNILSEISYQWCGINFDSALIHAEKCREYAQKSSNIQMIGLSLLAMGMVYDYDYQFDSSVYYYQKALTYSRQHGDVHREATTLFNIGATYYYKGELDSALKFYMASEPVFTDLNDEQNISRLYNNLGRIYEKTRQYDYAIEISKKSIEIKERLGDTKGLLNTYTNLSSIYQEIENYDSALLYSNKCVTQAKISGDLSAYKAELINLGIIYKNLDQPEKALRIFKEAEGLITEDEDPYFITEVFHNLSEFYFQNQDFEKTQHYLEKTREFLLEEKYLETSLHHYQLAYAFHKDMGNTKQSLDNLEKYMAFREQFLTRETLQKTTELEQLYEKEKRELEIDRLEATNQLQNLSIEKRSRERNGLIAISLMVMMLASLLFYMFKQKQKSLTQRETLLKEIHHRVKNNLQIISSLLNLQAGYLKDDAAIDAVKEGQNRVKSMALIHERLYQNDDLSAVEASEYIENLLNTLYRSFGIDKEDIIPTIQVEPIKLDIDTMIPLGLIVNELINNSLKYAFPDRSGNLEVSLRRIGSAIELKVKDDGSGFDPKILDTTNSYGWKMIQSLSRKLKAEISFQNEKGNEISLSIRNFKLVA